MSAFSACSTASISKSLQNIPIPSNLDQADAKAAVVFAISNKPFPEATTWQKTVSGVFRDQGNDSKEDGSSKRNFTESTTQETEDRLRDEKGIRDERWFIESIDQSSVLYGYKDDDCYLRIRLTIRGREIVPTVDGSKNLDQHGDKIHKTALEWADSLCINVRAALGEFSRRKAGFPDV